MRYAWVGLVGVLAACKQDTGITERTGEDSWVQAPTNEVDILFVIDNSHSMAEEQALTASGFTSFITQIEETGTDFHVAAITTSFDDADVDKGKFLGEPTVLTLDTSDYVAKFAERVQVGTTGSDLESGLEASEYALSSLMTTGYNTGFLRSSAYLLLIVVSDENDCSDEGALGPDANNTDCYDPEQDDLLVPVSQYADSFKNLKDDSAMVQVGMIIGPNASEGCDTAAPGFRYMEFAGLMGGLVGSICDADYSDILYDLGLNATGLVTSFELSDVAQPETLQVWVDEIEVFEDTINGWTYDAETNYLTFHGTGVPARGSSVTATYTIQSGA
jgi:hypothetical protein